MNRKKLALDALLLGLILAEFAYAFTGSTVHELLGLSLLGLFLLHGGWNWSWFCNLWRGRYSWTRILTLGVNSLLLIAAVVMLVSGLVNSDLLFRATGIELTWNPRNIHTAAAYWFLLLMAVHLGLHWKRVMNEAQRLGRWGDGSPSGQRVLRLLTVVLALIGLHAIFDRDLYHHLIAYFSFGRTGEGGSWICVVIQYLGIVGLFAGVAYYAFHFFLRRGSRSARRG